jgi:hypothetical protein
MGVKRGFLSLREEHRLKVFDNTVLKIFGPKWDGVLGGWRKLHNEEHRNFYYSSSLTRMTKSRRI